MFNLFTKYFLNFWVWWYLVQNKNTVRALVGYWSFTLGYFNILPMAQNLFKPLFQDESKEGKFIAFPIRLTWIFIGSFFQLLLTIPLLIMYLIYLILPLLPVWAIVEYLIFLF